MPHGNRKKVIAVSRPRKTAIAVRKNPVAPRSKRAVAVTRPRRKAVAVSRKK